MTVRKIRKIIDEKLLAFGFDYQDAIDAMDSVTYLSLVVEIEETFGIALPDELLASNVFKEADILSNTIKNLSPGGKTPAVSWLGNIKIVKAKDFKREEPPLTSEERLRVIVWNHAKLDLIVNASYLLLCVASVLLLNRYSLVSVSEYLYPNHQLSGTLALKEKLVVASIHIFTFILCFTANLFVHETLHIIIAPKKIKNKKILVISKMPLFLGICFTDWLNKNMQIVILLFPVIVISFLSISLALSVANPIAKYCFSLWALLNFGGSLSDLSNAIYIAFNAPKNSLIFHNYILPKNTG